MSLSGGVILLLALLTAATPQATPTGGRSTIPPLVWELIELPDPEDGAVTIAEPERYTVQFLTDGTLAIGADCNRDTGTYTITDGELEITLGASTLALCPPDSQATPFLEALDGATSFTIDADGVLNLRGDWDVVRLRPALSGVEWTWQDFRGGDDSVFAPEHPERYTITFLPEGRLAIQADCNRGTGAYTVDGPTIDLVVRGATRAMCAPGSHMDRFLREIDAVSSHVFRDGKLYLALPLDSGILSFEARAISPPTATPAAG